MSDPSELQRFTLLGIARRCTRETERFFQRQGHDPRFCFELFRRAVVEHSEQAWDRLYTIYRPLVIKWVKCHPAWPATGEEAQHLVNRAFEKLWSAMSPDSFQRFPELKSVLRYLQMCVHSAILDHARAAERSLADVPLELLSESHESTAPSVEASALDLVAGEELWRGVTARLNDQKERRVVYCSFALALKPREICEQFPELFPDVGEVYRIKENVLARLRRDTELLKLLA
jgi:RNA polymerase sigma factor (sigma-70 family)